MKWYTVDEDFLTYLRKIEQHIPFADYGEKKFKPFFGELFDVDSLVYITQISHPKKRHDKMKNNMDFYKLYSADKFIGVVNLNYMFPVLKEKLVQVEYKTIEQFRTFDNEQKKSAYISLLKKEFKAIEALNIDQKAKKLYDYIYNFPESDIAKRCIDFKNLETKCIDFKNLK